MFSSLKKHEDDDEITFLSINKSPKHLGEVEKLDVALKGNCIQFGKEDNFLQIYFNKTLRIPDNKNKENILPPNLGKIPISRVKDYKNTFYKPFESLEQADNHFFFPLNEKEAFWISFSTFNKKGLIRPKAIKIGINEINAINGQLFNTKLNRWNQDYLVSPPQKFLDGCRVDKNTVRQFIAMPFDTIYEVDSKKKENKEEFLGLQISACESKIEYPKKGRKDVTFNPKINKKKMNNHFKKRRDLICLEKTVKQDEETPGNPSVPEYIDVYPEVPDYEDIDHDQKESNKQMTIGLGGSIKQTIYKDNYKYDGWDQKKTTRIFIHIVDSKKYQEITGKKIDPPSDKKTYQTHGIPFFENEKQEELLGGANNKFNQRNNKPHDIHKHSNIIRDGDW